MHIHTRLTTLAFAAATLMLAGCHATVDARWANSDDTVDHWKKAMPSLPIEVRGALPDATNQQIAEAIPNSKTEGAANLASPRLIVELGQGPKPQSDAYCSTSIPDSAANLGAKTAMTLTICDGTRLVVSSRTPLDPARTPVSTLPKRVDNLKKLALIGISRSQIEAYQIQG
nr:hypothetical protein [Dyella sp. ASV24]